MGGDSETLGFGLCDNFHFGGGILKLSDVDSVTIFILGGILKLSDLDSVTIFIFGGVFWNSRIWTLWQFSFLGGGGILKLSDLDSVTIFILGEGVFWNCTSE